MSTPTPTTTAANAMATALSPAGKNAARPVVQRVPRISGGITAVRARARRNVTTNATDASTSDRVPLTSRSRRIMSSVARAIAWPPASSVVTPGTAAAVGRAIDAFDEGVRVVRDEGAAARLRDDEARAPAVGDERAARGGRHAGRELGASLPTAPAPGAADRARATASAVVVAGRGEEKRARLCEALAHALGRHDLGEPRPSTGAGVGPRERRVGQRRERGDADDDALDRRLVPEGLGDRVGDAVDVLRDVAADEDEGRVAPAERAVPPDQRSGVTRLGEERREVAREVQPLDREPRATTAVTRTRSSGTQGNERRIDRLRRQGAGAAASCFLTVRRTRVTRRRLTPVTAAEAP